jgi:hypothetical protein
MKDKRHIQSFNEHQENLNISDVSSLFFCSEWEWNEGRPKCDKQCKECKKTQKKNEN